MAHGPEKDHGIDPAGMTDDELYELVQERLRDHPGLDVDWIEIQVQEGQVVLEGRVGTDGEVQIAEKVVHDVLGIDQVTNNLVVDPLHREENSMDEDEVDDDLDTHQSDTADHLGKNRLNDSYPTDDQQAATERGVPYVPPEDAAPDGYRNGERH